MLAFNLDRLGDARLASKAEEIFMKYLDQRKSDYGSLVAFIVSKNSFFSISSQNSPKLHQKKLQLLLKLTQNMEAYD